MQLKYHRIRDDLRRRITSGQLRAGDSLPTNQQLMKRYDAALGTVRQAVVELQHEGLIRAQRGKGTFVADRSEAGRAGTTALGTVALLAISSGASSATLSDLNSLQSLVEARGYRLSVRFARPEDARISTPNGEDVSGYIVWGGCHGDLLEFLADSGIPTVFVGMTREGPVPPLVSHVTWNIAGAVDMIAEQVFQLGHRRVRLLNRSGTAYFKLIRDRFFAAAERAGLRDTCDEAIVFGLSERKAYVERLMREPDPPTAIICENAEGACQLIHWVQNLGWPVPQRLSVAAVAAAGQHHVSVPGLTHVNIPIDVALEKAFAALATAMETGRIVHVEAPIFLRPGTTCRFHDRRADRTWSDLPGERGG